LPELGAAAENKLPELGAATENKLSEPEVAAEDELPVPESQDPSDLVPEEGMEQSIPVGDQGEDSLESKQKNFLLKPKVLTIGLGLVPVMATVIVGAILVFIRSGTGIANGDGDPVPQGGMIVLGVVALWTMYILVITFFYADRDWVTDFGLFVIILGSGWGMYAVVISFPSTFLAIMRHLFFGYVALSAATLAIWLMAPYKGIGRERYNEGK